RPPIVRGSSLSTCWAASTKHSRRTWHAAACSTRNWASSRCPRRVRCRRRSSPRPTLRASSPRPRRRRSRPAPRSSSAAAASSTSSRTRRARASRAGADDRLPRAVTDERLPLLGALEALVDVLREHAPLALVLDDVDRADDATIAVLAYLQRRCADLPVVILAAAAAAARMTTGR